MKGLTEEDKIRSYLLKNAIIEEIRKRGMIPFVRFMELALYHPEYGYYTCSSRKIGKEGDFYTSPHVHPVFGRLVCNQIQEMWEILNRPAPFYLVELGPGHGWLSHDILTYSEQHYPEFFSTILYVLVEKSPGMIEEIKIRLNNFIQKGKVIILDPDEFQKTDENYIGCFLSNEFFDSLPYHRVSFENGNLREIYVTVKENDFREILGTLSTPCIHKYLCEQAIQLREGQRAEININALKWLKIIAKHLKRGFVLTIDFGFEAPELYAPYRIDGTLMCYFQHTTSSDPYTLVGLKDITAHVNFTALISFGKKIGLEITGFSPQYRFLLALGLLDEIASLEEKIATANSIEKKGLILQKLAMRRLLIPDEMGYLFKVLIQHKGISHHELRGFKSIPPLHWKGKKWD